ncbi:MAG: ShlB/FhaC/HecB family hemolysin secretion/activation protein [Anaerohalosphaeraceae bacterium]
MNRAGRPKVHCRFSVHKLQTVHISGLACGFLILLAGLLSAAKEEFAEPAVSPEQEILEKIAEQEKKTETKTTQAKGRISPEALVEFLPADDTPRYAVRQIQIQGNRVLTTTELLQDIPVVFDSTGRYQLPAEPAALYDFRDIRRLIAQPGEAGTVSARTIQGLTQYLLQVYQKHNYAGIYVYVPAEAFGPDGAIRQGILPIQILEARVQTVSRQSFTPDLQPASRTYLREGLMEEWSPVKSGTVLNQKKLNDFLGVMNLNPDRYVSALISKGTEPNALSVQYNVYEANPWHWFLQVDNSGTDDRKWAPRIGLIHTNALGFDDRFTAIYQAKPERGFEDEFSVYSSYDFPLLTPFLRASLFGAYSEYNSQGLGTFDFLGRGYFYGTQLRWHALQHNGWFFDVTGTLIQEESRTSPLLVQTSEVRMDLWGWGVELYKTEDRAETFVSFSQLQSFETSGDFLTVRGSGAADEDFAVYTAAVRHSRYLDAGKVHRLSGSFSWTGSDGRMVPSRMSAFGGMYTVRGYDEYEVIADGGILASLQYEYDLVQADRVRSGNDRSAASEPKPFLRKLAPAVFLDYGQARIRDALPFEQTDTELCSIGGGLITELGTHLTGTVYAGYPLIATENTREGKGRLHAGILIRW